MPPKSFTSLTLILSPYHVGTPNHRVGAGPPSLHPRLLSALAPLNIPIHTTTVPPVPHSSGELGKSFATLRSTSTLVHQALSSSSFPIILAGNCMATVGVHAGLCQYLHADQGEEEEEEPQLELGCVWFDAHDDYNTPDTLVSGYLDSMGVSMLSGESFRALVDSIPGHEDFSLHNLIYVGVRDVSDPERRRVEDSPAHVIWGEQQGRKRDYAGELRGVLEGRKRGRWMLHLDLDVLDSGVYGRVNEYAATGGLVEGDLVGCLGVVGEMGVPVSLTVASFDPGLEGGQGVVGVAVRAIVGFVERLMRKGVLCRDVRVGRRE